MPLDCIDYGEPWEWGGEGPGNSHPGLFEKDGNTDQEILKLGVEIYRHAISINCEATIKLFKSGGTYEEILTEISNNPRRHQKIGGKLIIRILLVFLKNGAFQTLNRFS